jgi:hypothetical protein
MDINAWLAAAVADAKRRGLPELEPLLTALAKSTDTLRRADLPQSPDEQDELSSNDERRARD